MLQCRDTYIGIISITLSNPLIQCHDHHTQHEQVRGWAFHRPMAWQSFLTLFAADRTKLTRHRPGMPLSWELMLRSRSWRTHPCGPKSSSFRSVSVIPTRILCDSSQQPVMLVSSDFQAPRDRGFEVRDAADISVLMCVLALMAWLTTIYNCLF